MYFHAEHHKKILMVSYHVCTNVTTIRAIRVLQSGTQCFDLGFS